MCQSHIVALYNIEMPSEMTDSNGGRGTNPGPNSVGIDGENGGSSSPRSKGACDPHSEGGVPRRGSGPPPPGFKVENTDADWNRGSDPSTAEPTRTSSFNNLAAALGSGLAESMEDATNGEHTKSMLTDSFLSNAVKDDISYARHSRHAASRMLGAVQTKDGFGSHKGLEVGSLFASFDSGERGLGKKGGIHDPFGTSDLIKEREGSKSVDTSKAFSAGSLGQAPSGAFENPYQAPSSFANSRLSTKKDLGLTVVEPDNFGRGSHGNNGASDQTFGLQRDMQRLWSDRGPVPASSMSAGSTDSIPRRSELQLDAEDDLRPFCWDTRHHDASRALVIMRAASLSANDVRSICEIYGAIESFRSDFIDRGVYFVSYYDMRCAQYAAMELQPRLQKLGRSAERVLVQFCVPLNSSSHHDESLVVLMDVPPELKVEHLASMLSSYGAVRSLKSMGGNFGGNSFIVEYHDIQDAKQAVLELESTHQFGPNVSVEVGARNPSDRKKGRELLALLSRWRHGAGSGSRQSHSPGGRYGSHTPPRAADVQRYEVQSGHPVREPAPQLVLGPDGRYSYVVVNDHSRYPGGPPQFGDRGVPAHSNPYAAPPGQHNYWQPQTHHFSSSGSVVSHVSHSSYGSSGHYPSGSQSLPYGSSSVGSHSHRMSAGPSSASSGGGADNSHLILDLDAVENGLDSRTSLMVRNIPNKYTQQMLLNEFTENGHGPGVIDFFYLPIDFKNRCNRGYAFINFVEYRDILAFHRRYFGKHWRTFNSDKICDITYARIQGKAAMLKRFENSALMEKDDEYKPLVFVSHGPEKGKRLPFPTPPTKLS